MSRLAKNIVTTPEVTVSVDAGVLQVQGPKGALTRSVHRDVKIQNDNGAIAITPKNETKLAQSLVGTYASHVRNMMQGVTVGFEKKLIVEGIGYKIAQTGDLLVVNVGFSHPIEKKIVGGLTVTVEKNTVTVAGIDKELVGQFAAEIREIRKPEPYKGKGIRYEGEYIHRKEGKKSAQ